MSTPGAELGAPPAPSGPMGASTRSAPLVRRCVAGLVDLAFAGGIGQLGVAGWLRSAGVDRDDAGPAAMMLVLVTYLVLVEVGYRLASGHRVAGRTLGMRICGLTSVATTSGVPAGELGTVVHALAGFIGFPFFFWGALKAGPALHDKLLGICITDAEPRPWIVRQDARRLTLRALAMAAGYALLLCIGLAVALHAAAPSVNCPEACASLADCARLQGAVGTAAVEASCLDHCRSGAYDADMSCVLSSGCPRMLVDCTHDVQR